MEQKFKIGQRVRVIITEGEAYRYSNPLLSIERLCDDPGFTQPMFKTIGKTGIVIGYIDDFPRVRIEKTGEEFYYMNDWLEIAPLKVKVGRTYEMENGNRVVIVADKRKHKELPERKLMLIGVEIDTDNILFFDKTGKSLLKKNHIVKQAEE